MQRAYELFLPRRPGQRREHFIRALGVGAGVELGGGRGIAVGVTAAAHDHHRGQPLR